MYVCTASALKTTLLWKYDENLLPHKNWLKWLTNKYIHICKHLKHSYETGTTIFWYQNSLIFEHLFTSSCARGRIHSQYRQFMSSSCQHFPNDLDEWRLSSTRGTRQSWSHTYKDVIEDWGNHANSNKHQLHSYSSDHLTDPLWRPLDFHHCVSPAPGGRPALFEAEPGPTLSSLDAGSPQGL